MNHKAKPGDPFPTEYDFAKAPKLTVPGDWNTQRESLMYYEGPIWYEKDFTYQPKPNAHIFLHVGAANYKSWFWVNGKKVCEHEGGFTSFNCEITQAVQPGSNFVVAAVDNTRREDNVPTLETDWWNYGGLTRDVSLIEVPEAFIDQYDLHLSRTESDVVEGWVHVTGASAGEKVEVQIPDLHANATADLNNDGVSQLLQLSTDTFDHYRINRKSVQLVFNLVLELEQTLALADPLAQLVIKLGWWVPQSEPYGTGLAEFSQGHSI